MSIWDSSRATTTPLPESILVTIQINTSSPGVPETTFEVYGLTGTSYSYALTEGNFEVPFAGVQSVQKSFSVLADNVIVEPFCSINPLTGMCVTTLYNIPPNTVFQVNWQIEDPPGSTVDQSGFPFSLLALVLIPVVAAVCVAYLWVKNPRIRFPSAAPS